MQNKAILYFQSGGPTPVINTSFYGVIREYQKHKDVFSHLYASHYGVEGLIEGDLFDIDKEEDSQIELLKQTPGQILGSSRKKLPSFDDLLFQRILNTIEKYNIGYILTNGGNDSMDTCKRLHDYFAKQKIDVKVLGIPKTVDNDLMITDHSLGYPSAARHIMDSAMMAKLDLMNYHKGKVLIMEIMGRDSGWLTASTALLPKDVRHDYIYLPEMKWDEEEFLKEIEEIYKKQHYVLIALSEGAHLKANNSIQMDSFGHVSYDGSAYPAAKLISDKLSLSTRVICDSTLQRSDATKITKVDSLEAIEASSFAVLSLLKGESGKMVAIHRLSSSPYQSEPILVSLEEVANYAKKIPASYLKNHQEMSDEFVTYLSPLVQETIPVIRENGNLLFARFRFQKPEIA